MLDKNRARTMVRTEQFGMRRLFQDRSQFQQFVLNMLLSDSG